MKLLKKLYRVGILTPVGLVRLSYTVITTGTNLMTLLAFAAKLYPDRTAVVDENEQVKFIDLKDQSFEMAVMLGDKFSIQKGKKVAIVCRNHIPLLRSLFAVSRLGADVYLLNIEMSKTQLEKLIAKYNFDLVLFDDGLDVELTIYNGNYVNVKELKQLVKDYVPHKSRQKLSRENAGKLIVLTGGTSGNFKTAVRKPSVFTFLNPFFSLLVNLNLDNVKSVYIPTPIYHGFGVASIFISLLFGMKMHLLEKFEVKKACHLIRENKIEAVTLVPLMLQRMLKEDANALQSLKCIISGGAPLSPVLVGETLEVLGDKLYNLYGTTEAGFSIMATPVELKYNALTIGKAIKGAKVKVLDRKDKELETNIVGRICVKNSWTLMNKNVVWVETGDLGYCDDNACYFLSGRIDEMIVSGGENVYPYEVESVLIKHAEINQVAVIGVPDEEFGQRLKAFVVLEKKSSVNSKDVSEWLADNVARYQIPKHIEIVQDLPRTSIGKIDKKRLF